MRAPGGSGDDEDGAGEAQERPCAIGVYPDGPYLVRGSFDLLDDRGRRIGVRRRTIALCRCGLTRTAPFCDGTHKAAGFSTRDPARAPEDAPVAVAAPAAASPPA